MVTFLELAYKRVGNYTNATLSMALEIASSGSSMAGSTTSSERSSGDEANSPSAVSNNGHLKPGPAALTGASPKCMVGCLRKGSTSSPARYNPSGRSSVSPKIALPPVRRSMSPSVTPPTYSQRRIAHEVLPKDLVLPIPKVTHRVA